jgi:plasmid maintenance system killer protein
LVIKSFADKRTAAIFASYAVRGLPWQIQRRARAKLLALDAAKHLDDLRVPPGNRLEALRGDREGSIASESMINGGSASFGKMARHGTSKSSTIIED